MKRVSLIRAFLLTPVFKKDWERYNKTGRFDMRRLKEVMLLLIANDEPLPAQWKDHPLKGNWLNHRECHISGDFLLIYRVEEDNIVFSRLGTHSELFK